LGVLENPGIRKINNLRVFNGPRDFGAGPRSSHRPARGYLGIRRGRLRIAQRQAPLRGAHGFRHSRRRPHAPARFRRRPAALSAACSASALPAIRVNGCRTSPGRGCSSTRPRSRPRQRPPSGAPGRPGSPRRSDSPSPFYSRSCGSAVPAAPARSRGFVWNSARIRSMARA